MLHAEAAARGPLLVTPHRAPEALFGLTPVEVDGDTARGTMRTAEWMTDPAGAPAAGMLGVLLDDVVGQATLTARPDGGWPVTTELSIDVVGGLPVNGSVLTAGSRLLAASTRHATACGEVRAPGGDVLAVATLSTHYVPGVPDLDGVVPADAPDRPPPGLRLHEVLGATLESTPGHGALLVVPPGPEVGNVAGHGHGGILAALADVVAAAAVADGGHPLRTASLRVAYLRPAVLEGPVRLRAAVVHRGRATAVTRVDVTGGDGRLCAAATVTAAAP
ncbi:PaaI family thioesterase [Actinomycetospora sp. CA-101289]|uniref:PaaI family thioesterase n=1 Tax=Actinomycetospora sp. CA-101289 TaxID=3239893 RepID=UPI003D99DC7C